MEIKVKLLVNQTTLLSDPVDTLWRFVEVFKELPRKSVA